MTAFKLNGEQVLAKSADTTRLLDVLRKELDRTDVKCACKEGECGACSVLLNGRLVNSCMVALGAAEGAEVVTIDGFSTTPQYKVLNDAFAAEGAVQCGYCTPGMILASHCLLKKYSQPTRKQIEEGLSGNLCRCTGYAAIIRAVGRAAKEGEGLW